MTARPPVAPELRAEQPRMAVLALIACAWLLGFAVFGATDTLGYLAPMLALLALLISGRYPGEEALQRRLVSKRPPERRRPVRATARPRTCAPVPRGGALLAAGLAGHAPPLPPGH